MDMSFENVVKYFGMLFYALLQIFMLCYYGSKLTTASENVAGAVYDSGWNNRVNQKRNIPLMLLLQRSQKPTIITAYKFAVVSLKAFGTVSF